MTTDGEVTFYNKEEDWELKFPIEPLLTNEVFAAMLAGQFQESNTKRICLHGYSLPVILRFIRDLMGKQHNMYSQDPVTIGHQVFQLVRLAHQFNEQHLVHLYADQCTSLFGSGFVVHLQTKQEERTFHYEFCKLVYYLSLSDYYDKAYQLLCQRPDPLFIYDDFLLMKSICHKNVGVTKVWLSLAAKHKAYKCMQVIIEEIAFSNSDIQYYHCLANKDLELPEDLLQLIVSKYPSLVDNFLFHQQTSGLGAILRFNPDNFSFWHKVFEDGHLALVKFAPKSILTQNKDSNSFGLTAVRTGWVNCVEILLAEGWDPRPTTALDAAVSLQNPRLVQLLLDHGATPTSQTVKSASSIYQTKAHASQIPNSLVCLDLIEKSALAKAFESDIYKAYSKANENVIE